MLEHPDITRIQRTGYPVPLCELLCTQCHQPIYSGETYGVCDHRVICADCLEEEWGELTVGEKFDILGYIKKVLV